MASRCSFIYRFPNKEHLMDIREKAALLDFINTVVWPGRTVRRVSTPAGEDTFTLNSSWNSDYDTPMAWIDGNRVTGQITWDDITPVVYNSGEDNEYTVYMSSTVVLPDIVPYNKQVVILISPGSGANYIPRDPQDSSLLGDLDCGGKRLKKIHASVDPDDAIQRQEVLAIIAAEIGAHYVLKAGDTMEGTLGVAAATEAGHAVRMDQVPLLDGTQPFTSEQGGVDATTDTGLVTKGQMDTAIAGAAVGLPNRKRVWSTPGVGFSWDPPITGKAVARLASGAGGGGGGRTNQPYVAGAGANGTVAIVGLDVVVGTPVVIDVGGGGYGGVACGDEGIGGPGGGGGGSATRVTAGTQVATVGGGGGGGCAYYEDAGVETGAGGPGGTKGQDSAKPGGAAGTLGAGTAEGGAGGAAKGGNGVAGTAVIAPALDSEYDQSWAFPVTTPPTGGAAVVNENGANGGHGSVEIRWSE
jgi:hypothetical protein